MTQFHVLDIKATLNFEFLTVTAISRIGFEPNLDWRIKLLAL